ncbi:butyrophilin subfamily 1 member A1-like [Cololabis saira]|uniref:butyrophilin subfamily 1 member A1-like n=1 Tax=Cololabis saira TaxID=129043 RepID=UPI002AD2F96E|nr:butyrophilin subfamily 1 member A1-like [Cololabis saira]
MRNMNRITAMVYYGLLLCASVVCGDTEVSCQFNETCILPCRFTAHNNVDVHWIQKTEPETRVHSYYHNKDQAGEQDQRFRGRTSLRRKRKNASLLLRGVTVQDRGRYQCFTSTVTGKEERFIHLNVHAPVQRVNIEKTQNKIICSSEGIYPEPGLTWTTSPPSSRNLQNPPTVHQTEQQLYSISSSLVLSDNDTDLDYICTVSTAANSRRTTLLKPAALNASDTETIIPCSTANYSIIYLTWRFNHSQIILTQSGAEDAYKPSERWKQHEVSVSETGSLMLKDLSSDQTGTYTCELTDEEETYVKYTFLHVPKVVIRHQSSGRVTTRACTNGDCRIPKYKTSFDRTGVILGAVGGLLVGLLMGVMVKYLMLKDVMVEEMGKGVKLKDLVVGALVVAVVGAVVGGLVMAVLLADGELML